MIQNKNMNKNRYNKKYMLKYYMREFNKNKISGNKFIPNPWFTHKRQRTR